MMICELSGREGSSAVTLQTVGGLTGQPMGAWSGALHCF